MLNFLVRLFLFTWLFHIITKNFFVIFIILVIMAIVGSALKTPTAEERVYNNAHSSREEVTGNSELVKAGAGPLNQEYTRISVINDSDNIVNDVVMICKDDNGINQKFHSSMMIMPHNERHEDVWGHVWDNCSVEYKQYKPNPEDFKNFSSGYSVTK